MGIYAIKHVYSITCDECGDGYDTCGEAISVKDQLRQLRLTGWKGTIKNIKCPRCAKRNKEGE